jgi:signal transduction histidine kinase/DNA-binding response OmpR family regulator
MSRILVIDDKQDNLIIASAMLKNQIADCTLLLARTGAEGIEKAKIESPDVILLDILISDMDGYEVCRKLKEGADTNHIPVIMLTAAKTGYEGRIKGLETGADAFLTTPINESELIAQVKVTLRVKKAEDQLRIDKYLLEKIVTERTRALEDSRRELAIRNRIADIFLTVADEEVFENVMTVIIEALRSRLGLFGYIDAEGSLVCPFMKNWQNCNISESEKAIVFPPETWSGLLGKALKEKKSIRASEPFHLPQGHIPLKRVLCAPMLYHEKAIGILIIANKEAEYDEKDRMLLQAMSAQIAPILYAKLQKDAQEKQRRQLEDQLRYTRKMEAIGTLAGGIAHDFNNILAAIIGFAELADMNIPDGPAKGQIKEVVQSGYRAKHIIRKLLEFSRTEKEDLRPVRIGAIVAEFVQALKSSTPSHIEVRQTISAISDTIMADPAQIRQILNNLCANACQSMTSGAGILEISLSSIEMEKSDTSDKARSHVRLAVRDTGIGIKPEMLERIFDPYFSTKDRYEGTGLGLAVVQGIVRRLDGTIKVHSRIGKGSVFEVFLPCIEVESPQLQPPDAKPLPRGKEKILMVDDEKPVLNLVQQMLHRLGYNVLTDTSPVSALEIFKKNPEGFDLVMTDMKMPEMTGEEFAKAIIGIRPEIPIILCTAHREKVHGNLSAVGIKEVIIKPFSMRDIAYAIRRVSDAHT